MFISPNKIITLFLIISLESIASNLVKISNNRYSILNNYNPIHQNHETSQNYMDIKIIEKKKFTTLNKENYEIKTRENDMKKSFQHYFLIYGHLNTIWLVGEDDGEKILFVSRDNGDNFDQYKIISSIDNIYVNDFKKEIVCFTDIINNRIYLSQNNGQNLTVSRVSFRPDYISFGSNEKIIMSIEKNDDKYKVSLSLDFGNKWTLIGNKLEKIPQFSEDGKYLYYVLSDQKVDSFVKLDISILKENSKFESVKEIVYDQSRINDFKISKKFLFVIDENLNLLIRNIENNNQWKKAIFNLKKTVKVSSYKISWAGENEILVSVTYDEDKRSKSDLYQTEDFNNFKFELSLEDINLQKSIYDSSNEITDLKYFTNYGKLFVANKNIKQSKRTFARDGNWFDLELQGNLNDYYLDLTHNFYFSYEKNQDKSKSFPEFLIANAHSNYDKPSFWVVYNHGFKEILPANFLCSFADVRNFIVAFEQNKTITELLYSFNSGVEWSRYKFTNDPVYANDLLKHSNENFNKFLLFATDFKTKHKKIFSFDINRNMMMDIVSSDCQLKCKSKLSKMNICVDQIKCDKVHNCDDDIDEKGCSYKETKPVVPFISGNIQDYFNFKVINILSENNYINLKYSLSIIENMRIKVNNYFIELISTDDDDDDLRTIDFKAIENQISSFKISNLNFKNSKYIGSIYTNVTNNENNSFEMIKIQDSIEIDLKNQEKLGNTPPDVQKITYFFRRYADLIEKFIFVSAIILIIVVCLYLGIKAFIYINSKFKNSKKIVDKAQIYKCKAQSSSIKNSIVNIRTSKIEPRYDLSPFNFDDKELLINMEKC